MAQRKNLHPWDQPATQNATSSLRPSTSYNDAFQRIVDETFGFATQSPENRREVANTLLNGGVYRPTVGTYKKLDRDKLQRSIIDNWQANVQARDKGLYDTREYATNPLTNVLSSTAYLQSLLPVLQGEYDQSVIRDAEAQKGKEYTAETESRWLDLFKHKDSEDEFDQWYNWLMADYLLGDRNELFDYEKTNARYEAMGNDEYAAEEKRLREQYEGLDWETLTGSKTNRYESQTASLKDNISSVEKVLTSRQTSEALESEARSAADFGQFSVYQTDTGSNPNYNYLDQFINSSLTWEEKQKWSVGEHNIVDAYMAEGYDFLLPEEIEVYNYYYQKGELDKASQYLESKRNELLYRRYQFNTAVTQSRANTYGVGTFIDARFYNIANAAAFGAQLLETAMGRDTPYSPAFDFLNAGNTVAETHISDIQGSNAPQWVKDVGSTVYKGFAGFTDNMARLLVTGLNPTASLIIAGLQSGSQSLYESSERDDMSAAAKIIKAIGAGAIEMGTEKIGLDELFSAGKRGAIQQLMSVMMSELGEESVNYVSAEALEAVVSFLFDHEAGIKSGPEFWQGLTDTWIQTAISSFFMGGGSAVSQVASDRSYGKVVTKAADTDGMVNFAKELGADSDAYATAQAIEFKKQNGKKVGLGMYGKLARQIEAKIGEEHASTTNSITDKAIEERLVELGTERSKAQKNAAAIRKLANGQTLTLQERAAVAWDDNATQVVQEMTRDVQEGEENRPDNAWVNEVGNKLKIAEQKTLDKNLKYARALRPDKVVAAAVENADKKADTMVKNAGGLKGKKFSATVADGNTVSGDIVRFEDSKDGLTAVIKSNGTEHKVAATDVNGAADKGSAMVLSYIQDEKNQHFAMSAVEASEMMQTYNAVGGDVKTFVQDYQDVYLSGYAGVNMAPTSMSNDIAKVVYDYGVQNAKADEANRAAKAGQRGTVGTGKTSWIGKVNESSQVGTQTSDVSLEEAKKAMKPSQRLTVEIASSLAKRMNIDVAFFESDADHIGEIENGAFIAGTNIIYIDINSGANSAEAIKAQGDNGTLGYAVMKTLGHELTHYMEANSADGYATYKQAVKGALKAKGVDWSMLVRSKIDNAIKAGQKLSLQGAEAEVVADASEYMLQDSKFVQELDSSVKGKIKTFIQNFMQQVKSIFATFTGGHYEANKLRETIGGVVMYTGNLQQLWDAGISEIIQPMLYEMAAESVTEDSTREAGSTAGFAGPVEQPSAETAQNTKTKAEPVQEKVTKPVQEKTTERSPEHENAAPAKQVEKVAKPEVLEEMPQPAKATMVQTEEANTLEDKTVSDTERATEQQAAYQEEPVDDSTPKVKATIRDENADRVSIQDARNEIFDALSIATNKYSGWRSTPITKADVIRDINVIIDNAEQAVANAKNKAEMAEMYANLRPGAERFDNGANYNTGVLTTILKAAFYLNGNRNDVTALGALNYGSGMFWANKNGLSSVGAYNMTKDRLAKSRALVDFFAAGEVSVRDGATLNISGRLLDEYNHVADAYAKVLSALEQLSNAEEGAGIRSVEAAYDEALDTFKEATVKFLSNYETGRQMLIKEGLALSAEEEARNKKFWSDFGKSVGAKINNSQAEQGAEINQLDGTTKQYSNRLLSNDEYKRVQSAWSDYIYRGYQFAKRLNGGIIIDLDNVIVYTDDEGAPQYVLEIGTDDRWSNNDVYNLVAEMERDGVSHGVQQRVLESMFGTKGAHFRTGEKRFGAGGQKRKGTGRNAGELGKRNRSEVSEEVNTGKQTSLRDTEYMDAVNSGDMVKAQQMVDEAAKRAGYTALKLYHGTRNFGFKKFDVNRMDDKMSIFVTDNERIAESYSGENPNRSLKDSVAAGDRYGFLNRPASELESLVQKHVDKNLRVPTEKELRQFTDFESSTILSAVDRVNDYIQQIGENADVETRQALQNIVYYGEKLAQIPYAELEDKTDAYKLRMKYSDAIFDLSFADRDAYDKLAALINRPVVDSANNLTTARFNDPFYNEKYATFTDKFNVTDKLGDRLFSGVYDLYADQSGLFVIDANDSNWNTIDGALIDRPGVRVLTRDVAAYAKQNGYKGAQIKNVRDSGGMTAYSGASDVYIFFDNTALKSADPVTYDDNGNVIPLSERFISSNEDIRYSLREEESSPDGIEIDTEGGSAYKQYSIRTWDASDYVQKRDEMVDRLVKTLGVSKNKAKKWINDVNSISAIILGDKLRLDYTPTAVEGATAFKSNPEYGGSIDMSTICAKRRLATGTLDAIQERLGDAVLTKDDFLRIREVMKERNYEVACGLCFVESSRKNLAKYTAQFLAEFNASHPDNQVSMTDFNTVDGLERTRVSNKEAYAAYEKFMNKLAQRKPKLFEKRTEYQHEILKKFKKDTTVSIKNLNGGLRLQSFSDFEIVHLIDMMQVITDMASVGLAGQAYTKVPDFAWALGDTGLKINLSLIAKGVDADGYLIFDDVEGMNHEEARKLRERYSKNVGTIVVTFTDEQLIAAMKNDMVDYIIPFHRSRWQKSDYKLLGLPDNTKDYTMHQNEKEGGKRVKENFLPNAYWDFSLSGKENAEKYLAMCNAAGRTPKFAKFLHKNSDGTYSLQEDGSTDGYWKLLIDFKMYDNDGVGSPQLPVVPDFNMKQAKRMLNEYTGEHDTFPVAEDVVEDFVKEYTDRKGGIKSTGGKFTVQGAQFSLRDTEDSASVRDYLMEADESVTNSIEEKNALTIYQKRLREHAKASEAVRAAEAALVGKTGDELRKAEVALSVARNRQNEMFKRITDAERTPYVKTVVERSAQFIRDEISGKTEAQISNAVSNLETQISNLSADLQGLKGAARAQREADIRAKERTVAQLKSNAARKMLEMNERYRQAADEIRTRRDMNLEIAKKAKHIKGVIKHLNDRIIHEGDYKNVKEDLKPAVHSVVRAFIDGFGSLVFDSKQADKLRRVYDLLAKDGNESEWAYSDDVARWIDELAALAEQDEERRMSGGSSMESVAEKLETYEKLVDIADHIYHLVKSADEMFVNGKKEQFSQYSAEVGNELIKRKDKGLYVGVAGKALDIMDDLIRRGNMTPVYFFESLKNSGLKRLYDNLMDGQRKYAEAILTGKRFVAEAQKKYNYYTWSRKPQTFKTQQGHTIALTVEQKMWVYSTAKREATNELAQTHHLDQGGFKYEKGSLPKANAFKAVEGSDDFHKLNAKDVAMITDTLTAEQKAYADALVEFLSEDMAEYGNRASMELFGIKKYNEKYYFPFKTASDQRYQGSAAGSASTTDDARVRHSPFTHALTKGANTALVMGNFTDVVANHINLMSTYSSFVVPIESLNRVLNRKVNTMEDGSGNDVTIRSLIGRKYGDAAQKYIADLLKDMNGGPQVDNRGGMSGLMRIFKRSAVVGSLSVAVQQPTAYIRAFAYVNPKYFMHFTGEGYKTTWDKMMKYSGTAVIKDMGRFDVGMGKMADEWIANAGMEGYNVFQRGKFLLDEKCKKAMVDNYVDFMTALPGVLDQVTWTHLWKAVEAEQADLHPGMGRNSEEFLRAVGERFDDVVNHTQVYDSILSKSQNMRSKNPLAQMSTSFMAESTLNANMYYNAITGGHGKAQAAKMINATVLANVAAAALATLINAWNKDDDERKGLEKYMATFSSRLIDNLNPLTMVPYLSDLYDIFTGYEPERLDLSVLVDLVNYSNSFYSKVADGKELTWRDYENFVGSWANLTGVPAKNVSRDLRRFVNFLNTDHSLPTASSLKYSVYDEIVSDALWKDSGKAYCQRFVAAIADGDTREAYDLWEYMNGTKGVSQSSLETNIRTALKEAVQNGTITPAKATEVLRKYVPYKNDKDNQNKPQEWLKETK